MPSIDNYLKDKLNDQQYKAATFVNGNSLILAWAGSGKTRTLTYKIANLIYGSGAHPSEILAVTFTNKAANEMKERLQEILKEIADFHEWWTSQPPQEDAPVDFDALLSWGNEAPQTSWGFARYAPYDYRWIGTFHGIFLKMLKQDIAALGMKYTTSFTIYDPSDSWMVLKKILKETGMAEHVELRECSRTISQRKNKWYIPEQAGLYCDSQMEEWILEVYTKYQKALEDSNALDFDDLLLLPKLLFEKSPETLSKWQKSYKHILVDEAQDTNAIQFSLMRSLAWDGATITFIGDDYQSIYRWRWAVMDNFLNVSQRWSDIQTFKLETNYRSKPHIVAAWSAVIKQNQKQYDKSIVPHREGNDMIRMFTFADEVDEATQVIELITKLKEESEKKWSDFTILYRTNAQSSPFEQVLLTEWIPYTVVGAFKFFERAEIKDLLSYIRCILNPKDSVALQRIINTPNRKIGKTTIDQLNETARHQGVNFCDVVYDIPKYGTGLKPATQTKIKQFSNMFKGLIGLVDMVSPHQLLEQIVTGTHYEQYLVKSDGKEKASERMDNIGQLINIAAKYTDFGRDALVQFLEEVSLMTSLEQNGDEAPDAIKLMSVHASKWLEFPYVFIVGLEEGIFPLPKAKFDTAELEEERRWMYVAVTRAKDHLFLSHAQSRQQWWQIKYNPPSRFLEEVPEELVKRYDMSGWGSVRHTSTKVFVEWDRVSHKLFWDGQIVEVWGNVAIIKFSNPKFGVRKMEMRFLHAAK